MSFLEEFQANLESLPNIIQRKYAILRDLDKSVQVIQQQNEERCRQELENYKRAVRSGAIMPDSSLAKYSDEALDEQKHAARLADEKVALAVQVYDLVDSHIQQLDQQMKKFNEDLQRERDNIAATGSLSSNNDGTAKPGRSESGRGGRKKTRLAAAAVASAAPAVPANPTSMDLDLPVDPNEPTYCLCNQVSYGDMVACDNPDCKIEWFHFGCVGVKEQPKGKWYCSDCAGLQKRRKGK